MHRWAASFAGAFVLGTAGCGPAPHEPDGANLAENESEVQIAESLCASGTVEVGYVNGAANRPKVGVYSNGTLLKAFDSNDVYVGTSGSCGTLVFRQDAPARATLLSTVTSSMPGYPNVATVNASNLFTISSRLPRLTITGGHVNFTQLTNLLANPQCNTSSSCIAAVRNLMSSTAGTVAEKNAVIGNQGIGSQYQSIMLDYGVYVKNASSPLHATSIADIRQVLGAMPFQIVEMIHQIRYDPGMQGADGSMGPGGELLTSYNDDGISIGSNIFSMPLNDGTIIAGLRGFFNVLIHEMGHQVDFNSPERGWRYTYIYNRGKTDPMARLGAAGGATASREEDFAAFWTTWFFDTKALLAQIPKRNNAVFACKIAHMADLLSYQSTSSVPYYKATAAGDLQRLGTLAVTRSTTNVRAGDDGTITAIDGIPINCPKHIAGDVDRDDDADLMLVGGSGWNTIPVGLSSRDGTFVLNNTATTTFATLAQASGARAVAGDFDNDGRWDLALVGGSGWTTIPFAQSNGNGTFNVFNQPAGDFASWAQTANVQAIPGDFNGDGFHDIALTGGSGWGSIPVAFSQGTGDFAATNDVLATFPGLAAVSKAVPGDFDGDGKTDIALIGGAGWTTQPVAYSEGGGSFRMTNLNMGAFASIWGQQDPKPVTGDFDGDGRSDIALVGGKNADGTPWNFVPIAHGTNPFGQFRITNAGIGGNFGTLARVAGVQASVGDVDGDGKSDIILAGGVNWALVVVAFSNGDGTFRVVPAFGNGQIPSLAQVANAKVRSSY